MTLTNLSAGWIAVLLSLLLGAAIGAFFHKEHWLGGYGSWRRRMLRLTHISLVGTGLLNISFALSVGHLGLDRPPQLASVLFVVGAATMPAVCLLSAWRRALRHLFFIPVLSLVIATADFICKGLPR